MTLWFHLIAARSVLRRQPRAVVRMALTSMVATLWCLVGGIWAVASWRETQAMASETLMELFVPAEAAPDVIPGLLQTLRAMPSIGTVRVIDGDRMLRSFQKDVGIDATLTDMLQPPTVVRCTMTPAFVTMRHMTSSSDACKAAFPLLTGVHWSREYVYAIERRRADILVMGSVAAVLSAIMFLLAILYAFRAELHRAEPDLNVGVLLGASSSFVAMPHVLVSTIAGALGLGIAAGILALAWPQMTAHASWLATVQPHEVVVMGSVLAVAGLLVCWWQSVSTVSRRTRAKHG